MKISFPHTGIQAADTPRRAARFAAVFTMVFLGGWISSAWAAENTAGAMEAANARPVPVLLAVFAALLALAGFTAAAETAIFSLNKLDFVRIRNEKSKSARALAYLLDHPTNTLTTILVLSSFVSIGMSLVSGALTESVFKGQSPKSFAAAAFGTTAILLVFGEVLPKCVGHLRAYWVASLLAWPTATISFLLSPFSSIINAIVSGMFGLIGVEEPRANEMVSEEELKAVMRTGEVSTVLEEDELGMIEGVFDLRHTFAEEIMTPRTDITAYPDTLTQEELIAQLRQTDRSRVVVYKKTLDHPLGFLLVKEILLNPATPWREKLREPLLVPLRARLLDLLKKFRYTKSKMALLVDEFGGVSGMITLHDLLEEIVGDIRERHEPARADFQKIAEGFWIASGHMNRGDLAAELDVKFPEDLGTTAGGFIMNSLGHVPSPGDELHWNGFIFKVARMAGRRITQIEIRRATPPTEPADSESQPKGGSD